MNFVKLIKRPSALLPIGMSLAVLAMVFGTIAVYGVVREPDEGTVAHLFQLLMAAQVPIVIFFAIKWLPRFPKQAVYVLLLQVVVYLAALAPVFVLGL
ncbi:MAG TPA: hypothetical protein VFW73_07705 [Lacipirellulaceae bacterium]|nr:hypothetical protein [Lacipirellulaceae bacterium]